MSQEKPAEQKELEKAFASIMVKPPDQRKQAIEKMCSDECEKCATEANLKLNPKAPEGKYSIKHSEALIAFGCQVPDCYVAAIEDPTVIEPTNENITEIIAECAYNICDYIRGDVAAANKK